MDEKKKQLEEEEEVELTPNEGVDEEDLENVVQKTSEDSGNQRISKSEKSEDSDSSEPSNSSDTPSSSEFSENDHTLDDLAEEKVSDEGIEPQRPKSFIMDEKEEFSSVGSQIPSSGLYSNRERGGSNKFKLLILLIIGLLVIVGSIYLLKGKFRKTSELTSPSPTESTEVESPTPSPTVSFDRSKYKIRVLNGTTKIGLAASVSAQLKTLGYQLDKVGNASSSSVSSTLVKVKSSATGLLDQLIKDLSPQFSASSGDKLPDSDSADGEVTLGTK